MRSFLRRKKDSDFFLVLHDPSRLMWSTKPLKLVPILLPAFVSNSHVKYIGFFAKNLYNYLIDADVQLFPQKGKHRHEK